MQGSLVSSLAYALRVGDDPVGAMLREMDMVTFTGHTISYIVDNDDDYEDVIEERAIEFCVSYILPRAKNSVVALPAGWEGYLNSAINLYLSDGTEPLGRKLWEGTVNSAYPGNTWTLYEWNPGILDARSDRILAGYRMEGY